MRGKFCHCRCCCFVPPDKPDWRQTLRKKAWSKTALTLCINKRRLDVYNNVFHFTSSAFKVFLITINLSGFPLRVISICELPQQRNAPTAQTQERRKDIRRETARRKSDVSFFSGEVGQIFTREHFETFFQEAHKQRRYSWSFTRPAGGRKWLRTASSLHRWSWCSFTTSTCPTLLRHPASFCRI